MRYSIELKDRIYVKGYRLLSFAKNVGKDLSNKYGQKRLGSSKKSTTDATNTALKRAIQKPAEDLIGNKIADKVISVSKNSSTELHSKKLHSADLRSENKDEQKHQMNDTCLQKKDNKLLMT